MGPLLTLEGGGSTACCEVMPVFLNVHSISRVPQCFSPRMLASELLALEYVFLNVRHFRLINFSFQVLGFTPSSI